ncbi:MAG: hypothetical protein AMXMBFR6_05880 [Betaproteobacteria bacterium]|nr:putative intracellular septation protein A [Rhodocyclaceae bacterium]
MKFLFDLFPVILFFASYRLASHAPATAQSWFAMIGMGIPATQAPILVATVAAIAGTVMQVLWLMLRRRKIDTMLWISLVLIVVFGGATLVLHDATFIKWKPTVLYWLFALVLAGSAALFGRNLLKSMMGAQLEMPERAWGRLNLAWAGFFALMGGVNLFVAYRFSESTWVDFKLYGSMGLMLLFIIAQAFFLARYMEPGTPEQHD